MTNLTVQVSFSQDHSRLDQHLETYRQLKRIDFDKAKQSFRAFKFGLLRHINQEELVLFPLFEGKTGVHGQGPTEVMLSNTGRLADAWKRCTIRSGARTWTAKWRNRDSSKRSLHTIRRKRLSFIRRLTAIECGGESRGLQGGCGSPRGNLSGLLWRKALIGQRHFCDCI